MEQKAQESSTCPVARALEQVGDAWTLLIVRDAFDGIKRFSDFQRNLGISRSILAARLRTLADAGILHSTRSKGGGSHGEYALTSKGRALFTVVVGLRQWGEAHCFAPGEAHSVLVERDTGRQAPPLRLENAVGQRLDDTSTQVRKVDTLQP